MDKNFKGQAVVALLNADLADRSFDFFSNDYRDFLALVQTQGAQPPLFPQPLIASPASIGVRTVFGNLISANDLVVVLTFDLGTPADELSGQNMLTSLCGLFIEENYQNYRSGTVHQVEVLPFRTLDPAGLSSEIARKVQVTPTGSVNTNSQYVILPALFSQDLSAQGSLIVGGQQIPAYTDAGHGKFAFMAPLPLRLSSTLDPGTNGSFAAVVIAFKGLASYAAGDLTVKVTPVFSHYQASEVMGELLATVL